MTITTFKAKYKKGSETWEKETHFTLSTTPMFYLCLCWNGYFVDTLMEDAENFLQNGKLCVDGGSNTYITNMREWVLHVLKQRLGIEAELRKKQIIEDL